MRTASIANLFFALFLPSSYSLLPQRRLRLTSSFKRRCYLPLDRYVAQRLSVGDQDEDYTTPQPNTPTPNLGNVERSLLGFVASIGFLETSFLNAQKFWGFGLSSGFCSGMKCSEVLNGPWSTALGIPLTVPGMMAYLAVILLATAPLAESASFRESQRKALIVLTTSMAVFSIYLITLLKFRIGAVCPWCILSASLSLALAVITWSKGGVSENGKLAFSTMIATVVASAILFVLTDTSIAIQEAQQYIAQSSSVMSPPPITRASSERELALATKLKARGAKMYGAYWCSHCFEQKQRLGQKAMKLIPYIECAKDGENSKYDMCKERSIPGYPTWEIDGKLFPGEKSLSELESILEETS
jgi:uncharacterized membrane protein